MSDSPSAGASPRAARSSRILVTSFGATLLFVGAVAVALVFGGKDADAATYTLTTTVPTTNWSDSTKWTGGPAGTYPGQSAGDTAIINLNGFAVSVDVNVLNAVIVQIGGNTVALQVPAGGTLRLASGSSSSSTSTVTLNGGTFGIASSDSVTSYAGPITINSGTFDVSGSLALASGNTLTIAGATTQGSGTITIPVGATMNVSCANNLAAMLATTVANAGTINYTCGSPNFFALDSGATINNSGTLSLQTDQNFSGDTLSFINNSGTISKSGGTSTTFLPVVNNNGTLDPGTAKIVLTGGGTHSGAFTLASSTSIVGFGGGTHDINAGATITAGAAGGFELSGGTLNVNTALTVPAMTQTGGTLAGTNTFITTNGYAWQGGDQNGTSGGSTQCGASTLKIIPSSAIHLIGRVLTGNGTVTYNPTGGGTLTLQSAAQLNITGGSFDLLSDATIASDASATAINVSGGTLTKSSGTKTIVNPALNINGVGTIQPQGTTISFGGGGSIGGTAVGVNTSVAGSTIEFSGGTTNLTGGTTITSGNFSLTGGTLSVGTATSLSAFLQSGTSTLGGTNTLSTGTLNWTGGTMSGSGTTSIVNTAFINGGSATTLNGWMLTNNGTVHYAPTSPLAVNAGANVNNNGTWALENSTAITSDLTSSPKFSNSGTLSKSVGGTSSFGVPILQSNALTLTGGSILQLAGGGQFSGGSVSFGSSSDKVEILTNNVTVTTGPSFTGNGLLKIGALGTLTNSVATTVPNLELDNSGTLAGTGTLTITSGLKWIGGKMTDAGTTLLANTAIGDMTALTSIASLDNGRTFTNGGTLTYNPTFPLTFSGAAGTLFTNFTGGIFDIQGNGATAVLGAGHLFNNLGTVKKTAGAGTFTVSVPFTNNGSGIVDSQFAGGTLAFTNGASQMNGGTMQASNATATIDFPSGTFAVGGGTFAGSGPIRVNGGTLTVNTLLTLPSDFEVSAGQLNGNGALTVPNAAIMKWSGGTITGSSGVAIEVNSGGDFTADSTTSSLIYDTRPLIVDAGGNFHWNAGSNSLIFQSGSGVSNNGTFTVATNGTLGNATAGTFSNAGLFRHTANGTLSLTLPLSNAAGGTVSEQGAGILAFLSTAGVTHTGTFDAQSGGFIDFSAGTHNFSAGSGFSAGTGTYKVAGGTVNLATNVSAPNFRLFSGALSGPNDLTTTSSFIWDGGQMSGAGTTNVASGTATFQSGPLTLNRNLTLSGNSSYNVTSPLTVSGGVTIANNATFDLQNGNLLCTCTPIASSFVNNGTFQRSTSATTPSVTVPIGGSGTLNVVFGGLNLAANASFNSAALSANGSVNFNAPTITVGSITGAGTVAMVSGAATVSGAVTLTGTGGIAAGGGTLTLDGTTSVPQLNQSGGTVTGAGNIAIAANSSWSGGTLAGSGSYTIPGGVTLAISNASAASTLSRTITNNGGSITYTPTTNILTLANGVIDNSGTLDLQSDVGIASSGTAAINNIAGGTLVRSLGTATEVIDPPVTNAGLILLQAATTKFSGGLTQTAGTTTLGPGNLAGTIAVNGGILNGSGAITGTVTNGGTLNPGTSPGSITITGDYTQTSAGVMNVDLNGTTAGTQYDLLDVSGNVTLDGTLNATLGYTPAAGDFYDVLKIGGTRTGDFATKNLPTFPAGGSITASYVSGPPEALRLQAIVTQSDVAIAQSAPASVTHTQNATITFTIANNGPDPATGVAATLNFSGANFVSATPSQGSCSGSGPVNCTIGTLGNLGTASITLVLNANALGTINTSGSATSTTFDPNNANNATGSASITVNPLADLGVTIADAPDPVNAAGSVTYTVTVGNAGPDTAATPTLTGTLTNGTISSAAGCTNTATTFTCSLASLVNGGTTNVNVVATAPNQGGTMSLAASVTSTTADLNNANNAASQSTTVTPKADLAIVKSATGTAFAGQNATFTITVTNNGPSDAASVTVDDPTPAGTTFAGNSGGCTTAFPCALGTLTPGQSVTITSAFALPSNATGSVSNTATVASPTNDPNGTNNTSAASATIAIKADVSVAKSGPANAVPNTNISYDVTVTNNGPSDATGVSLADPTPPRLTFLSASGACASYPCSIGNLAAGQSKSVHATYSVSSGPVTTITNTATVSAATTDPSSGNNSASVSTTTGCHSTPVNLLPADGVTNVPTTGTLHWNEVGAASYKVYLGAPGSGCNTLFATVSNGNILPYNGLAPGTKYEWRVEAVTPGCTTLSSPCLTFTTSAVCPAAPPTLTSPASGATVASPVAFTWTAVPGATSYALFASVSGAATTHLGTTTDTTFTAPVANGSVTWYVIATAGDLCPPLQSQTSTFTACTTALPPVPSVVGTAASAQQFRVEWDAVDGASRYEVDEARKEDFSDAATTSTTSTHVDFQHAVAQPTAFYYRVRSFSACDQKLGENSATVRAVILPIVPSPNPSANVPAGSTQIVVEKLHFDGFPGSTFPFTASVDKPWLSVSPSSGFLPPSGIDFEISADPSTLPNGTATGTLFVTIGAPSGGGIAPNATSTPVPVSINLVTPVSPTAKTSASANSLIIPSVGHLDGVNSQWRSDIRVTNTASLSGKVQLIFTPSDPSQSVKSTSISIAAGDTVALDDIVRNWYGVGALGDAASGALEIRPVEGAKADTVSITTVASSRTYNSTANGTLGQYIPAIPFSAFIGKGGATLGLQQIAQNAAYRTNFGVVEAGGKTASLLVTAFGSDGTKLFDFPLDLKANEQRQLNAFLASQNITSLSDGRLEVKVVSGDGRITAFASLIDNRSGDPLLISGIPLGASTATRYVLPGVADLSTGLANWRSDVRLFNAGTTPQSATLTFIPLNNAGEPTTASLTVNPGETKQLDAILANVFKLANVGGALHVTTPTASSLVVSGRTYNQSGDGSTYGQFIPAVTAADAVGKGGTLHVLQVEESVRYRTNFGIAEVTGKEATVEVSVVVPDSKISPKATLTLAPFEYRQTDIVAALGLQNVYNARIAVKVIDGDGRVTAYGSVIDMKTQDPTYVQAQR